VLNPNNTNPAKPFTFNVEVQRYGTTYHLLFRGEDRFRPIAMTTLTTVMGLLPLALGLGEGARLQMPLAVAIIGGLTSSTLVALFVVPILYRWTPGRRVAPAPPPGEAGQP